MSAPPGQRPRPPQITIVNRNINKGCGSGCGTAILVFILFCIFCSIVANMH